MRIAYTINGLIGGFVGRNSQTSDKSKDSTIILEYVSNLLRKNIIEPNNADVFITSDLKYHDFFEGENKMIIIDIDDIDIDDIDIDILSRCALVPPSPL